MLFEMTVPAPRRVQQRGKAAFSIGVLWRKEGKVRGRKNPDAKEKRLPLESVVSFMATLLYNELTDEIC